MAQTSLIIGAKMLLHKGIYKDGARTDQKMGRNDQNLILGIF